MSKKLSQDMYKSLFVVGTLGRETAINRLLRTIFKGVKHAAKPRHGG
jgi:hypothetical protein